MVKADGRGRPKGSSDGSKRKKGSGRPKGSKDKTKRKVGSGIKGHTPADLPRGRGRPKGSTNKASKVGGSKAKAGKPKKRGRPKGSKNKPASKATSAGKPKKRGRPVGSKNKAKGASAPKAVATGPPKKRGRPKGSTNAKKAVTTKSVKKSSAKKYTVKKHTSTYTVDFPPGALGLTLSEIPKRRRIGVTSIDAKTKSTKRISVGDCVSMVNDEKVDPDVPLEGVVSAIVAAKRVGQHPLPVTIQFMRW